MRHGDSPSGEGSIIGLVVAVPPKAHGITSLSAPQPGHLQDPHESSRQLPLAPVAAYEYLATWAPARVKIPGQAQQKVGRESKHRHNTECARTDY